MRRHALLALVKRPFEREQRKQPFFFICCALLIALCFLPLMINSDAFVTFRIAQNFLHGYGLSYNFDERVQSAPSVLWLLAYIPFLALSFGHAYIALFVLSLLCILGMLYFFFKSSDAPLRDKTVLILFPLFLSKSLLHFSFSGTQMPLICLLLSWFIYEFLKPSVALPRLALITTLMLLTSAISTLFLVPALLYAGICQRKNIELTPLLLALTPLSIWASFCLFYYGFIFSNPFIAQQSSNAIPNISGYHIRLLREWFFYDSYSIVLMIASIGYTAYRLVCSYYKESLQAVLRDEKTIKLLMISLGALLCFCCLITTDEALNRAYILPFFWITFFVFYHSFLRMHVRAHAVHVALILISMNIVLLSALYYYKINETAGNLTPSKVRQNVQPPVALSVTDRKFWQSTPAWRAPADAPSVEGTYLLGQKQYEAGPMHIVIDSLGRMDALLARLPADADAAEKKVDNMERAVPHDYLLMRRTGDMSRIQPELQKYYIKLRLIVSGPLFDADRLATIAGIHWSWYDEWLDNYKQSYMELDTQKILLDTPQP